MQAVTADVIQMGLIVLAVFVLARPLGSYMAKVYQQETTWVHAVLGPVERVLYRLAGVDPATEMPWRTYALSLLAFNAVGFATLYLMLRLQGLVQLGSVPVPSMDPIAAFNTSISFVTNTNWQVYAGERSISAVTAMAGLTWQNFASAATGMAVAVAFARGLSRREGREIGNFWVDLTRSWLYVLLPLSIVFSFVLVSQGVVQTLSDRVAVTTLEGPRQVLAIGQVASQEAVKLLGTNGGGFYNANAAHPFENPTPLTNALHVLAILLIPAGMTAMFGKMVGDLRQGRSLLVAMVLLFALGTAGIYAAERSGDPALTRAGADQRASAAQAGGNMEGKEVRFGIAGSAIYANATTAASCGSVNASMDSLTPLAGGVAMLNIALGEVVFGGVGSGLYGMLIFAILAVFIAGLMVGRSPEYLGKKIGPYEMKMAMLAVLALEAGILVLAGTGVLMPSVLAARGATGPHGLSEILYAFTSAVGNNGSAMAALAVDEPALEIMTGLGMLAGRYLLIIPVLAIAGSMARAKTVPLSSGTFPTDGLIFSGLLVVVILIVGALTFFPAYALGPVLEHVLVAGGAVL